MPLIVGIDPGYENCGISILDFATRKIVDHMTIHTARVKTVPQRFFLLHRELSLVLHRPYVAAVGYESPYRVGKAKQAKGETNYNPLLLMRVVGHIESLCWELGIPVYEHEPQKLKSGVLGRGGGNATKDEVRRAIEAIYGIKLNEHEADASASATVTARHWLVDRRIEEMQA